MIPSTLVRPTLAFLQGWKAKVKLLVHRADLWKYWFVSAGRVTCIIWHECKLFFLDSYLVLCRYKVLIHNTIRPRAESWPYLGLPFTHFFLLSGSTEVAKEVGRAKMQNSRALLTIKFISVTEDIAIIIVVMYWVMEEHHFWFMS